MRLTVNFQVSEDFSDISCHETQRHTPLRSLNGGKLSEIQQQGHGPQSAPRKMDTDGKHKTQSPHTPLQGVDVNRWEVLQIHTWLLKAVVVVAQQKDSSPAWVLVTYLIGVHSPSSFF